MLIPHSPSTVSEKFALLLSNVTPNCTETVQIKGTKSFTVESENEVLFIFRVSFHFICDAAGTKD